MKSVELMIVIGKNIPPKQKKEQFLGTTLPGASVHGRLLRAEVSSSQESRAPNMMGISWYIILWYNGCNYDIYDVLIDGYIYLIVI